MQRMYPSVSRQARAFRRFFEFGQAPSYLPALLIKRGETVLEFRDLPGDVQIGGHKDGAFRQLRGAQARHSRLISGQAVAGRGLMLKRCRICAYVYIWRHTENAATAFFTPHRNGTANATQTA